MKQKFFIALLVTGMSVGVVAKEHAAAEGGMQIGRYSEMSVGPTIEQMDVLKALVQTRFHGSITTVGQAIDYILLRSGYRLASGTSADPALQILTSRPLPEVHRELGPITLEEALRTLAGPIYRLVIDPLHRLVSFEIKEGYQSLMDDYAKERMVQQRPYYHHVKPAQAGSRTPRSGNVFEPQKHQNSYLMDHTLNQQEDVLEEPIVVAVATEESVTTIAAEKSVEAILEKDETIEVVEESINIPVAEENLIVVDDSVWLLSKDLARKAGLSRAQVAIAIFEENKEKFGQVNGKPNINHISKGTFLKLPKFNQSMIRSDDDAAVMMMLQDASWISG